LPAKNPPGFPKGRITPSLKKRETLNGYRYAPPKKGGLIGACYLEIYPLLGGPTRRREVFYKP